MSRVYAIANQKGGVGKTTTAVNVAACIAEAGYETLLVDVDPQANATVGLGIDRARRPGRLRGALRGGRPRAGRAARNTGRRPARDARGGRASRGANIELPRLPGFEGRLRDALAPVRERYEYVLLDCPALARAADHLRARRRGQGDRPRADRVLRARGPRRASSRRCSSCSAS